MNNCTIMWAVIRSVWLRKNVSYCFCGSVLTKQNRFIRLKLEGKRLFGSRVKETVT